MTLLQDYPEVQHFISLVKDFTETTHSQDKKSDVVWLGSFCCPLPWHGDDGVDTKPTARLGVNGQGSPVAMCFNKDCNQKDIYEYLGYKPTRGNKVNKVVKSKTVAFYDYDECDPRTGEPTGQTIRVSRIEKFDKHGNRLRKEFPCNPKGREGPFLPYLWDTLDLDQDILIGIGEKGIISARQKGIGNATSSKGGDNFVEQTYWPFFAQGSGYRIIAPDNDKSGQDACSWIASHLLDLGCKVKWIDNETNDPPKADMYDFSESEVQRRVANAKEVTRADFPFVVDWKQSVPTTVAKCLAKLRIQVRYNIRWMRPQIKFPGKPWKVISDLDEAHAISIISDKFKWKSKREGLIEMNISMQTFRLGIMDMCWNNQVDEYEEYLNSLSPWDGVSRLKGWLTRKYPNGAGFELANKDDVDISDWCGEFAIGALTQRTLHPGCKLDEMPVFQGPGGIGKSTIVKWTLPKSAAASGLYKENFHADSGERTKMEKKQGAGHIEWSEMAGMKRAEVEKVKAELSMTHDDARLVWRYNPEVVPRRFALMGTTNHSSLPANEGANRRFAVCEFAKGNPAHLREYLTENREHLVREAIHWLRVKKHNFRMPRKLTKLQSKINKRHTTPNEIIKKFIEEYMQRSSFNGVFDMTEFFNEVAGYKININASAGRELTTTLRDMGFDRKQVWNAELKKPVRIWTLKQTD